MRRLQITTLLILLLSAEVLTAAELLQKLKEISQQFPIRFEEMETDTAFSEKYLVWFTQPVDHFSDSALQFDQRVFISHRSFDRPVIFITEGYSAGYAMRKGGHHELTSYLQANEVVVEHRYFGKSTPSDTVWNKLTVRQAAADHHDVMRLIRELYNTPVLTTGISKGGQTAMFYRTFYPDDANVTVSYVAPLNFSPVDCRVYDFLENVGSPENRQAIRNFQLRLLKEADVCFPEFVRLARQKGLTYPMGDRKGFELTVLEYSFAFWQWGNITDSIPGPDASPQEMIRHLDKVAGLKWVSDEGIYEMLPFFYQAMTEIGFYGYDITGFEELVSFDQNPVFDFTMPKGMPWEYHQETMQKVDCFVRHNAEKMMFIYGETDPWSATKVEVPACSPVKVIVKPGGSHLTRIRNLPDSMKREVLATIREWAGLTGNDTVSQ